MSSHGMEVTTAEKAGSAMITQIQTEPRGGTRQRLLVGLLCLSYLIVGCMDAGTTKAPVQQPPTAQLTMEQAAARFIQDYKANLAKAALETATNAESGKLEDLVAVNEFWVKASAKARADAEAALTKRMGRELLDSDSGKPRDGADATSMFKQMYKGFSK